MPGRGREQAQGAQVGRVADPAVNPAGEQLLNPGRPPDRRRTLPQGRMARRADRKPYPHQGKAEILPPLERIAPERARSRGRGRTRRPPRRGHQQHEGRCGNPRGALRPPSRARRPELNSSHAEERARRRASGRGRGERRGVHPSSRAPARGTLGGQQGWRQAPLGWLALQDLQAGSGWRWPAPGRMISSAR